MVSLWFLKVSHSITIVQVPKSEELGFDSDIVYYNTNEKLMVNKRAYCIHAQTYNEVKGKARRNARRKAKFCSLLSDFAIIEDEWMVLEGTKLV